MPDALQKLAIEMADDDARVTIESYGCPCPRGWKQMFPRHTRSGFYVRRALKYLRMRGLLVEHPTIPNRVKVKAYN